MGCQNSKLSSDAAAVPPKVRPLLRRRLDEMRRRRKHGISKKELLNSHSCKTISSAEESVASATAQPFTMKSQEFPKPESIPEENKTFLEAEEETEESVESSVAKPVMEEKSNMAPTIESDEGNEDEPEKHKSKGNEENVKECKEVIENIDQETSGKDRKEEDEEECNKNIIEAAEKKEVAVEKETTKEVNYEEEDDDDDDDEETSDDEGSEAKICPGSPSFRVYCIETLPNTQENETLPNKQENDCKKIDSPKDIATHMKSYSTDSSINGSPNNEKAKHTKSLSADSVHSMTLEASHDEVQVTKIKKKDKKVKKIRRAMRKGGPVKNLFKVQSCYHSSKGSSHERVTLLATKSAAA
uniref:chromatin modification-related protein EAF7-like isoform X1 n=1 Tax=Ziziphus jujuba TaxID=326968 RepID=A0A6P3YY74_ZIZJJ